MFATPLRFAVAAAVALAAAFLTAAFAPSLEAKPPALLVPSDYATIQAAIDASAPGGMVKVAKGTYTEQLTIEKDLTITGAGMDKTVVRAPSVLVPNPAGRTSIVEVRDGASVDISRLTVSGPGAGSCASGALGAGIRVNTLAHLDLSHAAVRNIHNSPIAQCSTPGAAGSAIVVGAGAGPAASIDVHHSIITNYQSAGILVLGEGSIGNISHSVVRGPGAVVGTQGIELVAGAVGVIEHNAISGNICPAGDDSCGSDFFTEFQNAGIVAGGNGPGTVITHNFVFGNQIGLYLSESDEISHNLLVGNYMFAIGLVGFTDGFFTLEHDHIFGGGGGVWVVAAFADTTVTLDHVTFTALSGAAVETLEDGGFTATVIGGP